MKDLEELLVNAGDFGRRIIIVEAPGKKSSTSHGELNDLTTDLFGRPVVTDIVSPQQFEEGLRSIEHYVRNTDIVLFSGYNNKVFSGIKDMLDSISAMNALQTKLPQMPKNNYAFVIPAGEDKEENSVKRVWKFVLPQTFGVGAEVFDQVVWGPWPSHGGFSLPAVLTAKASSIKHRVGSLKDARFMDYLSHQFTLGSNQTGMKKTFLCINDKLKERNGRFVVINHETSLDNINFTDFHAVFIDNGWDKQEGRLGKGMASLMKVSRALESQGLSLPIIYQTAHNLESISAEERTQISSFPDTHLVSKNLAPKVSRSKGEATKELEASRILMESRELKPYIAETVPISSKGFIHIGDNYLTFSRAGRRKNNRCKRLRYSDCPL